MTPRRFVHHEAVTVRPPRLSLAPKSLDDVLALGRLPLEQALRLSLDVARALREAHQRGRIPGQLDATSFELTSSGGLQLKEGVGAVLAPEAVAGFVDARSDLYAAGVVMFRLFTGASASDARRLAFEGVSPATLNGALDDALIELVVELVAARPAQRPTEARVVELRLEAIRDELGVSPVAMPQRPQPLTLAVPLLPSPHHRARPRRPAAPVVVEDDDDDEVHWTEPVRFDAWAIGAIAFSIVAVAFAFVL